MIIKRIGYAKYINLYILPSDLAIIAYSNSSFLYDVFVWTPFYNKL